MKDLIFKLKRIMVEINQEQNDRRRDSRISYLLGFIEGLSDQATNPAEETKS